MKSQQEIEREAGLRAEVERLTRERDEAHERADHFMAEMKLSRQRAESAKSELALLRPVVEAARALVEFEKARAEWGPRNMDEVDAHAIEMDKRIDAICAALARAESAEKGGANV